MRNMSLDRDNDKPNNTWFLIVLAVLGGVVLGVLLKVFGHVASVLFFAIIKYWKYLLGAVVAFLLARKILFRGKK